jgi:hypothetical protein
MAEIGDLGLGCNAPDHPFHHADIAIFQTKICHQGNKAQSDPPQNDIFSFSRKTIARSTARVKQRDYVTIFSTNQEMGYFQEISIPIQSK